MATKSKLILVTGGARSGKSTWAREHAESNYDAGTFVATAQALDSEMQERIKKHQQERGSFWTTKEVPFDLSQYLAEADTCNIILVDCLALWVSNHLLRDGADKTQEEIGPLVHSLEDCSVPLIVVTNEVGMGVVPDNLLARQYRDLLGLLNQKVASVANQVVLMTAGIPFTIKSLP